MRPTLTSMRENQGSVGDRNVPLIDVPGHPRERDTIRAKYAKQAKRVVFVIDSREFKDEARQTAEYVALCTVPPKSPGSSVVSCVSNGSRCLCAGEQSTAGRPR